MFYCDPDSRYCYALSFDLDDMTIDAVISKDGITPSLVPEDVPLRSGPPTREELLVHYPHKFSWAQLKTFVNSGDLGLLKRDRKLQGRYMTWAEGIKTEYGSLVNYLLKHRLQWGKPDNLSLLSSALEKHSEEPLQGIEHSDSDGSLPTIPADAPKYFTADTPPSLISIIMNDWPYSVPPEIEHALIWTCLPVIPPDLPPSIAPRVLQDGLWGFTGSNLPPPSPSTLHECLPALSDWNVTADKLIRSPQGTLEEDELVRQTSSEIDVFVRRRWVESEWETAWFVNPPRLQSVPGLAHIHVFARHKSPEEMGGGY